MLTLILHHVHALADAHPAETAVEQALSGSQLSNSKGPAGRSAASNSSIRAAHRLPRAAAVAAKVCKPSDKALGSSCRSIAAAVPAAVLRPSVVLI